MRAARFCMTNQVEMAPRAMPAANTNQTKGVSSGVMWANMARHGSGRRGLGQGGVRVVCEVRMRGAVRLWVGCCSG